MSLVAQKGPSEDAVELAVVEVEFVWALRIGQVKRKQSKARPIFGLTYAHKPSVGCMVAQCRKQSGLTSPRKAHKNSTDQKLVYRAVVSHCQVHGWSKFCGGIREPYDCAT